RSLQNPAGERSAPWPPGPPPRSARALRAHPVRADGLVTSPAEFCSDLLSFVGDRAPPMTTARTVELEAPRYRPRAPIVAGWAAGDVAVRGDVLRVRGGLVHLVPGERGDAPVRQHQRAERTAV